MKYIQGIVKAIIYHNEENSYTIIKVKIQEMTEEVNLFLLDDTDYVTITGYFPVPMRGEEIRFFGEFKEHNRYGLQYQVKSYEKLSDTSIPGLIEYLSSDLFKGVGVKTAQNIVQTLGKDTITKILDDKNVLETVPRLSSKLIDVIYDSLLENKAAENTLIKLYGYGITPKMAIKIYKYYQNETIQIIEQNPYQLIYDIEGIGFERADIIAKRLGFEETDPLRIKAMIMYLYQLMGLNYGHTFLYMDQLIEYLHNAVNKKSELISEDRLRELLNELIEEQHFVEQDNVIKLKTIDYAEKHIINRLKNTDDFETEINERDVYQFIELFEQTNDITYTTLQKKAIVQALKSNVFILTGGPGTGKTTVIKGLIFAYCKYHQIPITYNDPLFPIKLVAPTGRAAKRMNEATMIHAETIHRLLGYGFDGTFMFNKDNKIEADVVIIDEASMIDVFLASQLFQSIPHDTKIIIVGDEDQLPSVGPGQILKDIIDTDMFDYTRLKTIHRQAENSHILDLAYHVNRSSLPSDIHQVQDDRLFVEVKQEDFHQRLLDSIHYLINQGYDLWEDIQILIPMYRGMTGIDQVNQLIQQEFNPQQKALEHGEREFRIGDKVIQLVNQIEDNIMNGDQGVVTGITSEEILIVDFLGTEVSYKKGDLINLKHAYATSIHKSQGSEYPVVILPIFRSYSIMLKRKLLYTGITRAKEKLLLFGNVDALEYGVKRLEDERQSTLKQQLINAILEPSSNQIKESKKALPSDLPFDTLGEDLNGISPYDFLDE
jgi:exodeoxyribonuclease V alpha subunit